MPQLRRFARLLTGEQRSGDALVYTALKTVAADGTGGEAGVEINLVLYRAVVRCWEISRRLETADDARPFAESNNFEEQLDALSERARAAFILVTLEDLSHAEAATVIGVSETELEQLLQSAHQQVSSRLSTSVLIIEDELLIAFELEELLTGLGHFVTSIVRTYRQAVKEFARRKPGLIMADVQLADGSSGIEAVQEAQKIHKVPVVFVTAYPERLLTGLGAEPAFLVAKPFRREHIVAVVSQALFFEAKNRWRTTPEGATDYIMSRQRLSDIK